MSEDFGKSVKRPALEPPTQKQIDSRYPDYAHLANDEYNLLIKDYFKCVTMYFEPFTEVELLEQQLNRRDLDTVCAYELYQMKKQFNNTDVLNMSRFAPHLAKQ